MVSPSRQRLPEELAHVAPGPRLGALLAGIDPSRLTGPDCVAVLQAWHRQVAHTQARFMETVVQVALCRPAPDDVVARQTAPGWQGGDEIRAALAWTRQASERQLALAWHLWSRLPEVHEALLEGRIDQPRARVFSDWTTDLEPEQAERICALLLPKAAALTTGQLIDRIRQMIIAIDPDWAARRFREAVRSRRVIGYRTPDGTANLSGLDLPIDQAAAASANIEVLARRVKRAGDRRPLDHIRADLFLGMLDGTFTGCDEPEIIARLLAQSTTPPDEQSTSAQDEHSTTAPDQQSTSAQDEHSTTAPDQQSTSAQDDPHDAPPADRSQEPDPHTARGTDTTGTPATAAGRTPDGNVAGDGDSGGSRGHGDGDPCHPGGDRSRPLSAGSPARVELRVRLSTLLEIDRHPAELAGWGYIHAELARSIAIAQTGAQWRYAVCDDQGALLHDGLIRSRPRGHPARAPRRHGVVEIQIPLSLLRSLYADPRSYPHWDQVIERIVRAIAVPPGDRNPPPGVPDRIGGDGDSAALIAHDRRFPGAWLRRHVQAKDRSCQFPGCRMPARETDIDHLRQWQAGGPTVAPNLVSLCRHDHRIKDEGGWRLSRQGDGLLLWTSRLGLTYTVRRPPVMAPLPAPMPGRRSVPAPIHPDPTSRPDPTGSPAHTAASLTEPPGGRPDTAPPGQEPGKATEAAREHQERCPGAAASPGRADDGEATGDAERGTGLYGRSPLRAEDNEEVPF